MSEARPLFPAFLDLRDRSVLLVGGGAVAASKLRSLRAAAARVRVVAPTTGPAIEAAGVAIERRSFVAADLDGVWLVVAAAPPEVNRVVAAEAGARGIFVNAVDDRAHCTVFAGGVLRRGTVTLSISSGGEAPALTGLIREALDELLPADLEDWASLATSLRESWRDSGVPLAERRPLLLAALNRRYAA